MVAFDEEVETGVVVAVGPRVEGRARAVQGQSYNFDPFSIVVLRGRVKWEECRDACGEERYSLMVVAHSLVVVNTEIRIELRVGHR